MRCYLMKDGHIVSVEDLPTDLSDQVAVEQDRLAFESKPKSFHDFEIWQRTRKIYQHSVDRRLLASSSKNG